MKRLAKGESTMIGSSGQRVGSVGDGGLIASELAPTGLLVFCLL